MRLRGVQDNQLKVRLTAPPIDSKATYCTVQIHPKSFAVAHSQVKLISGAHNRQKRLIIHSPTTAYLWHKTRQQRLNSHS